MSTTHRIGTSVALALRGTGGQRRAGRGEADRSQCERLGRPSRVGQHASAEPVSRSPHDDPTALKDHQHGTVLGGLLGRRLRLAIRAPGSDAHEHRAGFRCLKHQSL